MTTIETIYTDDKKRRVRIEPDDDGSSCDPRDDAEGLVQIVTPRHHMTEHTDGAKFESQHDALYERGLGGAFGRYLKIFHDVDAWPVYRYEHGNVALSLSDFRDRWDSGMIGWAYINPDAEKWEGIVPRDIIKSHLESLTQWMNGEVYGYIVEKLVTGRKVYDDGTPDEVFEEWEDEEEIGYTGDGKGGWRQITMSKSCWGFLGLDYAIEQAKEALGIKEESDNADS